MNPKLCKQAVNLSTTSVKREVYWHDWVQENQRKYDENIEYFERSEKMWAQFAAEDRLRSRAALVSDRKLFGLGCLRAGHFSDRFSSDNFGSVRILDSMPMTNFSFTPFEREEAKPKFLIMPPSNLRAVVAQMYRGGSRNLSSSPLGREATRGLKSRDSSLVPKKKNPSILPWVVAGYTVSFVRSRMNVLRRQRMLDKQIESNNLLREQVMKADSLYGDSLMK
ncbi:unnamed protein product [Brassica oleracea var. botrytis]|uniref:(rape) hypothetical protein n=1 Tax=Brassica napus TaxID=3708 RepID=A0A816JLR3_BRANA|nr:unnamed protein product [Brassica napus]